MPIHGRLKITRQAAETFWFRRILSGYSRIPSLLLALGTVLPTSACAVATDDGAVTSTEADAARLPPGGDIDWRPPRPPFPTFAEIVEISAGKNHTCARRLNGKVFCWGLTSYGQAGPATATCYGGFPCVTQPAFVGTALQVELGYDQSCVVDSHGFGKCWGANHSAQLGNGSVGITANFPAAAQPISYNGTPLTFSQISAGDQTGCGVIAGTGQVFCWGMAGPGAYPLGTGVPTPNPLKNAHGFVLDRINSVSTWFAGACIQWVLTNGWGTENYCFRGTDSAGNSHIVYAFDYQATRISTQAVTACADKATGTVECFGSNLDGQLGDGTTNNSTVPVTVGGGMQLRGVSVGQYHACALDPAGTAFCWGNAWTGGSLSPVAVSTPAPLTALASGDLHTCGLGNNGQVYCWGNNAYGQIGTGSFQNTTLAATQVNIPL